MREEIKKQLNKLVSSDHNVRNDSFLNISLSVESVLIPSLTRDNEQLLDLYGLKKLRLTESEARIVLEKMSDNLCNNTIPLEIQVGIVSLLGKFKNIKYLEAVMRFLGQSYYNLDNEQVYSTLASINPQDFSKEERVLIIELIQKSALMEVLVELRKRNNDNVNDAIFNMWGELRGINCLDECYFEEYVRSVLWYIRENYILLDNEGINSVLKLLSVEYLSSFDSETLKSLLNEYDFSNILNKIETRKFQDYVNDLKGQTPEELFDLVESFDEGEYKKDQEELKKTIGDIRKFIRGKE